MVPAVLAIVTVPFTSVIKGLAGPPLEFSLSERKQPKKLDFWPATKMSF